MIAVLTNVIASTTITSNNITHFTNSYFQTKLHHQQLHSCHPYLQRTSHHLSVINISNNVSCFVCLDVSSNLGNVTVPTIARMEVMKTIARRLPPLPFPPPGEPVLTTNSYAGASRLSPSDQYAGKLRHIFMRKK